MTVLCQSRTSETTLVCPKCNHIAVPFLRRPRVCLVHPSRGGVTMVDICALGAAAPIRRIECRSVVGWYDEQQFDCIRTCRACNCEWGQS